ncbi:MAG: hypothetical protein WBM32_00845, partial [Crocosphaera sp.]
NPDLKDSQINSSSETLEEADIDESQSSTGNPDLKDSQINSSSETLEEADIDESQSSTGNPDLKDSQINASSETLEEADVDESQSPTGNPNLKDSQINASSETLEEADGDQEEVLTTSSQNQAETQEISQSEAEELSPITFLQVRELFEKERGTILHFDYIVHHFYGHLSESQQQKILPSISELLQIGALEHKWARIPDAPNCWTLTLLDFPDLASKNNENTPVAETNTDILTTKRVAHLLSMRPEKIYELRHLYSEQLLEGVDYFQNSRNHYLWSESGIEKLKEFGNQTATKKHQSQRTKVYSNPSMLPAYRGLSKEKAVERFFKKNPDKAFSITEITEAIYGDLNFPQARKIRDGIIKTLSSGTNLGLWRRVPGVNGVYRAKKS